MNRSPSGSGKLYVGISAMALVVLVSNILVQFPINDWLTWAAFTYPIAFLVTDVVNRHLGVGPARQVVLAGFALGLALSVIAAFDFVSRDFDAFGLRIAAASGTAFIVAQLLDVSIFDSLRRARAWWKPPLISSAVGSTLDTALFFSLAFAGTGLPWLTWGLGDLGVKFLFALGMLVPFALLTRTRRPKTRAD